MNNPNEEEYFVLFAIDAFRHENVDSYRKFVCSTTHYT